MPLRRRDDVRFSMSCDHFFCGTCVDDKEEKEPQEYEVEREGLVDNSQDEAGGDKADDPYIQLEEFDFICQSCNKLVNIRLDIG